MRSLSVTWKILCYSRKGKLEGLNILNIYRRGSDRLTGNAIIFNEEFNENYVVLRIIPAEHMGDLKPLGTTVLGHGNNGEDGTEGWHIKILSAATFTVLYYQI